MRASSPCPDGKEYRRLLAGRCRPDEVDSLTRHLESCPRCVERIRQLDDADAMGPVLRAARGAAAVLPQGNAVEGLIARVCRLGPPAPSEGIVTRSNDSPDTPSAEGVGRTPAHPDLVRRGRLGPYRILRRLGAGGMGQVFLAEDPDLKRHVALKTIQPELAPDASARERFRREAQAAAALRHEHVVTIYHVGEDEGIPYLVLELLEGESLDDRVRREGPLPPAEVLRVGREAASGLAAAHARKLVHRDVKPANVWLEAPHGRVKILDFGLARSATEDVQITRDGRVPGTPLFMAPEQAAGHDADERSDLFSLGGVLYYLATGATPFAGKNAIEILHALAVENPAPPHTRVPAVPTALSALVLRLLAKYPAARPPSARAVVEEIEEIERQLSRPRPRRRSAVLAVLGAAVVLVAAVVAAVFLPDILRDRDRGQSSFAEARPIDTGPRAPESPPPRATETVPATRPELKPPPPPPPPPPSREQLARGAHEVLGKYCHRCHGANGTIEGGLNYVMDLDRLVVRGKVKPGNADGSKLYELMHGDEKRMPPEDEPQPRAEEVAAVGEWIKAGAPALAGPAKRAFVSPADVVRLVHADLLKANADDARFLRYFTLAHLFNAGLSDDELQTYRYGLSKLVNSLSWEKEITPPKPVDREQTVLRIDLRDYQWSAATWEQIAEADPYAVAHALTEAREAADRTRTQQPFVRADWFVFAASRPPLYHDIFLKAYETDRDLEAKLGVNVARNLDEGRAVRAGFLRSGVAVENRLIERHPLMFGAYWRSYDFAGGTDRQNLKLHPHDFEFKHAGGEIIFSLPNGLQGYMLVDRKGNRIDKGPTSIVTDPRQKDRAVVNGISCMACHARGVIPKDDEIRVHVEERASKFPDDVVRKVRGQYADVKKLRALFDRDATRFRKAVLECLDLPDDPKGELPKTEPVAALAARFEEDLDLELAAAELGVNKKGLVDGLERAADANLGNALGLHRDGDTTKRQTFAGKFPDLVRVFQPGNVPLHGEAFVNSIGMRFRLIPAPAGGRPFYLGAFEVTQQEYHKVSGVNPSQFAAGGAGAAAVAGLKDTLRLPVERVTWDDANKFCADLSALPEEKGRTYRLPKEAEWEHACRGLAGRDTPFHFGTALLPEWANFGNRLKRTAPVGSSWLPNDFGLYDLHGNVSEWCGDATLVGIRFVRGGSWKDPADQCKSDFSDRTARLIAQPTFGFRVLLEAPKP